jgi:tetratricopeptide (TPR) repeat protein
MRRLRERFRVLSLIVAASVALASAAQAAPSDDAIEKERTEVYREGVALAEAGRWGEALERFQRVVALRSAPRALLALASAEEHVGRLVSAKRTYGKARDDARAEHDEALAGKAEAALQALEPRVPRLALVVPQEITGATAWLEGAPIEISDDGVDVDPGVYHLVVTAPGRRSFEERVIVSAGQRKDVLVALDPVTAPPAPRLLQEERIVDAARPTLPRERRGPPVGAWILGGAGLAAAAIGIIYRVHERSIYDEAARAVPIQDERGNAARDRMKVGTAVAGVGLGALAGAVLWWTLTF